jgi:hypothetical protein
MSSTGPDTQGTINTPEADTNSAKGREMAPQMRTSICNSPNRRTR